jgi:hypothetical protein
MGVSRRLLAACLRQGAGVPADEIEIAPICVKRLAGPDREFVGAKRDVSLFRPTTPPCLVVFNKMLTASSREGPVPRTWV